MRLALPVRISISHVLIILLLTMLLVPFAAKNVEGHGTLDQHCSGGLTGVLDGIGDHEPAGQTFTPSQSPIIGFSIHVRSTNGVPTPMIARLLSGGMGGSVVASVSFPIPMAFGSPSGDWLHVHFSGPITVTPGLVYALDLDDTLASSGIKWTLCTAGYGAGMGYASGGPFMGGADFGFRIFSGAVQTDWAVLSVGMTPITPRAGDSVAFGMVMTALSTTGGYPQTVGVECQIDGGSCGAGTVTYPGPTGVQFTVSTTTPWPATVGSHTLTWRVSTADDPNPANNMMSTTFTVQPAEAQFDFSISANPSQQTVAAGGSTTFQVLVNLVAGAAQPVSLSLSGAPSGVSGSFNPPQGSPTFSSTLSVTTTNSVPSGSYSLIITGTGGGRTHTAAITLIVSQAPDFRVEANPASQIVNQGEMVSYSVNVVGLNGFNSEVTLALSGLPSGASGVFSVPSGVPNFASTLTITLRDNVQTGTFTLTMTGTGGGLTRVANVVLTINPKPVTQTTTQITEGPDLSGGGIIRFIERNSLLLLGLLALLIIILLVFVLRGRKPSIPPPPPPPVRACPTCGKQLMYVAQYDRWYCNNCKEYK
jgi:hypothetical protein